LKSPLTPTRDVAAVVTPVVNLAVIVPCVKGTGSETSLGVNAITSRVAEAAPALFLRLTVSPLLYVPIPGCKLMVTIVPLEVWGTLRSYVVDDISNL